jgi:hypothetical protein
MLKIALARFQARGGTMKHLLYGDALQLRETRNVAGFSVLAPRLGLV